MSIFSRTKSLEKQCEEFLDITNKSTQIFLKGVEAYLANEKKEFEESLRKITLLESSGDSLRRDIEDQVYTETLIPESRGDMLALLENIDNIINQAKQILMEFSVEIPRVPEQFHADYIKLSQHSAKAVDEVVISTHSFLVDPLNVRHSLNKVYFWEHEADRQSESLKRKVFRTPELELSEKFHLRYFALHIELMADKAEDVADRLAIYTIKRSI
ncbi:MAG: DUF47 domain-containing protein [Candidatus Marinimicrobia bacterium CG08_land_8_20_14_0_20_45_22]|nr:MAG: DUF47 domain-containing protein [Candidatus Marinimicrobia bacterium CG08_land_8_20_14_0_20_45_22]